MGVVNVKLINRDQLVIRKAIGSGTVNNKKFEFGITGAGHGYVEYRDRIVVIDNQSFVEEAIKIIDITEE